MGYRIRYVETANNPNLLQSVRVFYTSDSKRSFKVELDLTNKRFRIRNAGDDSMVMEAGDTKNVTVLKRQAKKALKALGIYFRDEERDTKEVQPEDEF